ncbi:MAG: plasmid recombination protein, partial [Clostridia bacterium]
MVGKGCVSHNNRLFHAANTNPERSHLNSSYCNEKITDVYHVLFDEAVSRYHAKQTRSDRQIKNYYEKIRTGKQEKLFHELILQIGNQDDMPAGSENGALSAKVLDAYMQGFQARNPNLRVFSAHLHMDEATPHLHIDFVPFTTGSKRGLDTRVSLKQALAAQGFQGGSRSDTEWNQWVQAEKETLSAVMLEHGIEWAQKGTHQAHLSVLDFKTQERSKEVAVLEEKLEEVQSKTAKVEEIGEIVAKPAIFDGKKVVISRDDFENVKTLAQKQMAVEHAQTGFIIENK